jgi:hypothetical protein
MSEGRAAASFPSALRGHGHVLDFGLAFHLSESPMYLPDKIRSAHTEIELDGPRVDGPRAVALEEFLFQAGVQSHGFKPTVSNHEGRDVT